jgi:hypothetical protein
MPAIRRLINSMGPVLIGVTLGHTRGNDRTVHSGAGNGVDQKLTSVHDAWASRLR